MVTLLHLLTDTRTDATHALRPIAIGSTIARAVSMVAAHVYRQRFSTFLQPPPPGSTAPSTQPLLPPLPLLLEVAEAQAF